MPGQKDKWEKIGNKKMAGVLAPLFSLYSRRSFGCGDLEDLKLLIDWVKIAGNSLLELLPMNELGSIFCPYDALSGFALEPLYISLGHLADTKKAKVNFPLGGPRVDYKVKAEKLRLLGGVFKAGDFSRSEEFREFQKENYYWLADFALFKVIKEYQGGRAWYDWEEKYKNRDTLSLENFRKARENEILFQIWLQWLLFKQFREAKDYARRQGILLEGDLPILVSRDSADVWSHPEFFKLEFAAGAPPDMYCAKGQRWGMPTYNWERIAGDNYRYIKEKLKYAENFYDILRIDHVVGLFRVWSIPYDEPAENQGLYGFFDPQDEGIWGAHGRAILQAMMDNTSMLLCAEDLGIIPRVCTDTLKELGIPGNDVQRWAKDYKRKHDFLEPQSYRALSVAMLSTHDTTNWPAWWENEAGTVDEGLFMRRCSDHRQIGFERIKDKLFDLSRSGRGRLRWQEKIDSVDKLVAVLGRKREELADFMDMYLNTYQEKEKLWKHFAFAGPLREKCDKEIMAAALKMTLSSEAVFCVQLITDWLYLAGIFKGDPYQYRINTPGTISAGNWSLTIPLPLEDLLRHRVNKEIRKMIESSKRI